MALGYENKDDMYSLDLYPDISGEGFDEIFTVSVRNTGQTGFRSLL